MTNSKTPPSLLANVCFILWPTCLAIFAFSLFSAIYGMPIEKPKSDLLSNVLSAIVGYSATASFFFLALPRVGYFRKIDRRKHFTSYALSFLSPAIIGVATQILAYIAEVFTSTSKIQTTVHFLFFATILQFMWSLIVLSSVVFKSRESSQN